MPINVVQDGKTYAIDEADVPEALKRGFTLETADMATERVRRDVNEKMYGGVTGTVAATALGGARAVTGGLSDVALSAIGAGDTVSDIREVNPLASTIGEVAGSVLPIGVSGLAARAGARAARIGESAGALAKVGAAARGAAVEGAIQGAGSGVSELALSDDPLTLERALSTIGSSALFGAGVGGAAGAVGKGAELGLRRAKVALDNVAQKGLTAGDGVSEDLVGLDAKGLRAARQTELDAIESARVSQRSQVADELKAFRQEATDNKLFLVTKDAEESEIRSLAARSAKADRQLRDLIDNPKRLAKKPELAEAALQRQESALEDLVVKHRETLRAKFAGDATDTRRAALDYAETALEKNRSLQARLTELTGAPKSPRLDAIQAADDVLRAPKQKPGLADSFGDAAMGYMVGAIAGVPYLGPAVQAASWVMRRLGADSAKAAARGSAAIDALLDVGAKIGPKVPPLATKVLSNAAFSDRREPKEGKAKKVKLADVYRKRSDEIRLQVMPMPDGASQMSPAARAKVADKLSGLRAVSPVVADRFETIAARRIEYLASKLPRRPDAFASQVGPDTWQPSDMEMRAFARHVAAVEDPHAIVERLASGQITPEDVEAMKAVYPEMHADIVQQVTGRLGELRARLPYQRRLALSMFTGVAVDPAMDPAILGVLQSTFANEANTEGGTMAPRAQPAFGSVTKPEPTPAQQRGA